jgi:hypothetical protein
MVRKIFAVLIAIGLLGICCGCGQKKTGVRVVEQISVQWVQDGQDICRIHDDPEKMRLILNRLRTLGQRFSPDIDPNLLEVPAVAVLLVYSDGSQRMYQIKPDRYIRIGQDDWQQANPGKVTSLRLLLLSLTGNLQT